MAPRRKEAPPEPAAPDPRRTPRPQAVVLYIEDNLANLHLIERLMTPRPNIRLLTALQGRLRLELAQQHWPQLILLDLHLPDLHGHDVLRQLQADPCTRDIPVVVISADASRGQVQRLLGAGARTYLTKPLDRTRLLVILDDTLVPNGRSDEA